MIGGSKYAMTFYRPHFQADCRVRVLSGCFESQRTQKFGTPPYLYPQKISTCQRIIMVWMYVWLERKRAPLIRNIISLVYHYIQHALVSPMGHIQKILSSLVSRILSQKILYIYGKRVCLSHVKVRIYIFQTWRMLRERKKSKSLR